MVFLDLTDPSQIGALRAVMRFAEFKLNYPRASVMGTGRAADSAFATVHQTRPIAHPTQAGRWMLPIDAGLAPLLATLKTAAKAQVQAGTASAVATVIANFPAVVATLDATWSAPLIGERSSGVKSEDLPADSYPNDTSLVGLT